MKKPSWRNWIGAAELCALIGAVAVGEGLAMAARPLRWMWWGFVLLAVALLITRRESHGPVGKSV